MTSRRTLSFFFFTDTASTEIYTLSLHDALPISYLASSHRCLPPRRQTAAPPGFPGACSSDQPRSPETRLAPQLDRKSTRLNSSHTVSSYAVFCLKKKKHRK